MAYVRKSYADITDSILSQITRGIVNEKHEFARDKAKYMLGYAGVKDILKVEGASKNAPVVFEKGKDYRLSNGMLEWARAGDRPDDRTPFFVSYAIDTSYVITDINPGSVTRTVVESVALEMDYLYAQMDQVYKSGFIDTATGKALDLVVSILGVNRKGAGYATGDVTFGRNTEPRTVEISKEAHVFDGRESYELKGVQVKTVKSVEGTLKGSKSSFALSPDYSLDKGTLTWVTGGKKPDPGSVFYVDYTAYEKIVIPLDMRVSTYSRKPGSARIYRTVREVTLNKSKDGRWEADVPVMAMTPGKEGNAFAGAITVMPKPPIGIEYVINKRDILNGTEEETDEELRERAKRALDTAGKATARSIKSAVQGVDGVTGEVIVIDQPDGVPGILQVIASGGEEKDILKAIEDTRSAGIRVEFKRPSIVPLDISLTIVVVEGIDHEGVKAKLEKDIRLYAGSLNIGDDVIISRIVKAALNIPGIRDAKDISVNGGGKNIDFRSDEKPELRSLEIRVEV